jgi:hypothetical protein
MTTTQIDSQYATGVSRRGIEQALVAAGKDPAILRQRICGCSRTSTRWAAWPLPHWWS